MAVPVVVFRVDYHRLARAQRYAAVLAFVSAVIYASEFDIVHEPQGHVVLELEHVASISRAEPRRRGSAARANLEILHRDEGALAANLVEGLGNDLAVARETGCVPAVVSVSQVAVDLQPVL